MLHSLESTGLGAKLQPRTLEAYQKELREIEGEWKNSLHFLDTCDFSCKVGIKKQKIPSPCLQVECPDSWYRKEKEDLSFQTSLLMAEGCSIPCTFRMLLKHFYIQKNLESICNILVRNGYRTKDFGTLTLAFDKVLEQEYGIQTKAQPSFFSLCESIFQKHPVVALVPTDWLQTNSLPGYTCIIIWQLKGKKLLVSTTTSRDFQVLDMSDTFKHIQRAWACIKSPLKNSEIEF